ncbi:hypothetical protein [Nocardiopsis alkaliphila]|uniref:hypothetical protein n=1 Tax=Nocardiopsis alkaliphila TaxID=225762 RepID=UPI00034A7C18|nr:hypothetical protein [Nocardiopsis alkaliphila]
MNRKLVTRFAFTALVVPALAFGAPAVAMADTFFHANGSVAGPEGAAKGSVTSVAWDGKDRQSAKGGKHHAHHGGVFYHKDYSWAGPHGAGQGSIVSGAF